jgi:SAM-dependent methyltransferase
MPNYENEWWPLIYDQFNHGRHEKELAFYTAELRDCTGPVLEIACGTGMILLELLARGVDIYGLDISPPMLDVLYAKAERRGVADIRERVSCQNMVEFAYDMAFDAVFIPARSFLHLTQQEEQIACLRRVYAHLADGGRLLLNFFTPNLQLLLAYSKPSAGFMPWGTFTAPDTGETIHLSVSQTNDPVQQIQYVTWRFQSERMDHTTEMFVRWIYKEEFQLLLRLAGFSRWQLYSGFHKHPYDGRDEMVWIAEK